jgi:hypothetical protein
MDKGCRHELWEEVVPQVPRKGETITVSVNDRDDPVVYVVLSVAWQWWQTKGGGREVSAIVEVALEGGGI